jgi:hypothetical protein
MVRFLYTEIEQSRGLGMSDLRNQFSSSATGGYLSASLRFATADTRTGITGADARDFSTITAHAAAHPERTDLAAYVGKVTNAVGRTSTATATPTKNKM